MKQIFSLITLWKYYFGKGLAITGFFSLFKGYWYPLQGREEDPQHFSN